MKRSDVVRDIHARMADLEQNPGRVCAICGCNERSHVSDDPFLEPYCRICRAFSDLRARHAFLPAGVAP